LSADSDQSVQKNIVPRLQHDHVILEADDLTLPLAASEHGPHFLHKGRRTRTGHFSLVLFHHLQHLSTHPLLQVLMQLLSLPNTRQRTQDKNANPKK